jgi:hypothetical protein
MWDIQSRADLARLARDTRRSHTTRYAQTGPGATLESEFAASLKQQQQQKLNILKEISEIMHSIASINTHMITEC